MKIYGEMGVNKYREMNDSRFKKGLSVIRREGFLIFGYRFLQYLNRSFLLGISPLIMGILPKRYFLYSDQKLEYFKHKKSLAWTNERSIEVPIVMNYVYKSLGSKILEIGAVLPHYYPAFKHTVVDKFENGFGILNEDVLTFSPKEKYDLIISISTLEHVGFDDDLKDPEGILKAIRNLQENCLNLKGKIIITLPIGYNKTVDQYLFEGKLKFNEKHFFKRINCLNCWKEINENDAKKIDYTGFSAEGIVIGVINSKL